MTDDDPGVLSLSLRRRHASLESENAELRARIEQLAATIATMSGLTTGKISKHDYVCGVHTHVIVDDRAPIVECAACHERLDPYTVLLEFARRERNFHFALVEAQREKARLTEEIERLKRQRSSLRQAIRRSGGAP